MFYFPERRWLIGIEEGFHGKHATWHGFDLSNVIM
jgi:hypothetical protein